MAVEEEYQDVLQNIEFAIVRLYREDPSLLDYAVLDALQALIRFYQAEERQRRPPALRLSEKSQRVFEAVKEMCEWRLGRGGLMDEEGKDVKIEGESLSAEEIVKCLRRIHKSAQFWTKKGGRQGYLNYVSPFIP